MSDSSGFVCPNCGLTEAAARADVSTLPNASPWYLGLMLNDCAKCGCAIPCHLSRHWSGVSLKEARRQWSEVFWPTAPFPKTTHFHSGANTV